MTKLQYPLCGPQVCLQRAACLTCLPYTVVDIYQQPEKPTASVNKVEMMEASFCSEIPYTSTMQHGVTSQGTCIFKGFFLLALTTTDDKQIHSGISHVCLLYNMLTSVKDNKNIYLLIKHIMLSPPHI